MGESDERIFRLRAVVSLEKIDPYQIETESVSFEEVGIV
jgi:hypothetical protein